MYGIIYCITNKKKNKKYVGQTTVGLKKRYPIGWWRRKSCHNNYLKYSIEKYGIENFEWEVLEYGITSIEELNRLEKFHAEKLNTYIPNGYNIRPCGSNCIMAEETKRKISVSNSKSYSLKDISGTIHNIDNLSDFCKERGLHRQAILNLLCGWSNYSQGFIRVEDSPEAIPMAKTYSFISPSDEVIKGNIIQISKRFGLKIWTLHHLIRGQVKVSKGWKLLSKPNSNKS